MGISYLIFWVKLFVLSLPFMLAGALIAPIAPKFNVGIIALINIASLVFGFFIMVMSNDEDELSAKSKKLLFFGKTVFLFGGFKDLAQRG